MPNYGDPKYWEQRYDEQKEIVFDWLEDYETLKPIIEDLKVEKSHKIINLGCGNAEFSECMYDDGYLDIHNIDIAPNVIEYMLSRAEYRPKMTYEVMDVRNLKYPSETFDLAIDKSTIDALLCGDHSFLNVAIMTKEIQRILKVGGIYLIISYGQPDNRVMHLEREHLSFDISIFTIKKDISTEDDGSKHEKVHYVYICRKKPDADEVCKLNFEKVYNELEKQEILEDNYEEENDEEANIDLENDENVNANTNKHI